jgi:hypothetical protein
MMVGMRRFELPTPRPPDVYSNRTELHPENEGAKVMGFRENWMYVVFLSF